MAAQMMIDVTTWRTRISEFGVSPGDSDEERLRKNILTVFGFMAALALIVMFGFVYLYFGETAVALAYIGYGLFVIANLLWFGLGHRNLRRTAIILAVTVLPTHWLTAALLGGFSRSHGVILWGLFFPVLGSLVFLGGRLVWLWFILYAAGVAGTILVEPYLAGVTNNVPPSTGRVMLAAGVITISLFSLAIMLYFVNQRNQALALLRREQAKSEALLRNILPDDVAADLKEHGRAAPQHYDEASILFADVVNFTPLSATLTPAELVDMLNEVFSLFDALAGKYGLEKIKTIGDAYMVAAGVPQPRADHAEALTRMALEVQQAMESQTFRGHRLSLRLGINSGPVVAGVIGERKFSYDLWGDTVNTASRMESHGVANAIQVTEATHRLIRDGFHCEPRGHVVVKGKGEMPVWHVLGENVATPNS